MTPSLEPKMRPARREQLLSDAAKRFDELGNPFATEWLVDHAVTLDECGDLSEDVARAIRFYLRTPKTERTALALQDAMKESGFPDDIAKQAAAGYRMGDVTRRLKELKT